MSSSSEMPVKVIRSARRKHTVAGRINSGVLEVRIPGWMNQREEAEAVADMLSRVAKRTTTQHASDEQLAQRAHELNAKYLDNRATVGSIRWVSNQNTRWGSTTLATGDIRISDRLQKVPDYVLDSVIIHELTHTFIPGHPKEFWNWADRAPKAERAKGYLEAFARFGHIQED